MKTTGIRLYFDEDMSSIVAARLRKIGWDILTTHQVGNSGIEDHDQLRFATQERRILVTRNYADFQALHEHFLNEGQTHTGIIVCFWRPEIQKMIEALVKTIQQYGGSDWTNVLAYA